ncbi:MAG: substrate-binding domain-containing protein [Candidatus Solibacter usitatus]|nr:substrate-binding domain-containing protein [Candidatus Solibacter usitatus]
MTRRDILTGGGAAWLAGCARTRRRRIAVIPKGTAHLFWVSVQAGALAAGKKFNVEILWNGPASETEYARQIQIIDSMIAQRVDGIAVAASERQALVAPIERAVAAGIPVTVFDSGVDSANFMTFVGTDNVLAGRMGARKLAELLGGKGAVAVILHAPGSLSTMDREIGFRDTMKKEYPGIRIVAEQYGMSDRAKARAATENILAAHPGLDGLFTTTEPSAAGAVLALRGRGLNGRIRLVTNDSSDALVEEMRAGNVDAFIAQDPYSMAFQAVKTLVDKLEGRTPPGRIDMQPTVVTVGDLDKPEVREMLHPELRKP